MQIHQLKPKNKNKSRKRVGRGGKHGTYSGRGQKGQKSRAGRKMQPSIRELFKRYPKLRGYRTERPVKTVAIVNLEDISKKFKESDVITPKALMEKRLIRRIKGRMPTVKILGKSEKKFSIENCLLSKKAQDSCGIKK